MTPNVFNPMQKHKHGQPRLDASFPKPATLFIVLGYKKSNLAVAKDKNFKVAIMNKFKDLKEDMN